jgi:hypothetical protein
MGTIHVLTPLCTDCNRLAVGIVRWRYRPSPDGEFSGRCQQHVPWRDPAAEFIGIHGIHPLDPARQRRPPPDPAPDVSHAGVPDHHPDPV